MENYLTVTQYALKHSKDTGHIRHMLINGVLPGTKIGNQWVIKSDTPYPIDHRYVDGKYTNVRRINDLKKDTTLMKHLYALILELRFIYSLNLTSIVLYGSYARRDQTEDSDIDIALFIEKSNKNNRNKMVDCVSKYELVINHVLSVIEIENEQYEKWKDTIPFYKNIHKEGITLWKRK